MGFQRYREVLRALKQYASSVCASERPSRRKQTYKSGRERLLRERVEVEETHHPGCAGAGLTTVASSLFGNLLAQSYRELFRKTQSNIFCHCTKTYVAGTQQNSKLLTATSLAGNVAVLKLCLVVEKTKGDHRVEHALLVSGLDHLIIHHTAAGCCHVLDAASCRPTHIV